MYFDKVFCFFGFHSRTFKERRGMRYWSDCMVCGNPGYVEEVNMVDFEQVSSRSFNGNGKLYSISIRFNDSKEGGQFIYDLWHCVDPNCGTPSSAASATQELTDRVRCYRTNVEHDGEVIIRTHGYTSDQDTNALPRAVLEFLEDQLPADMLVS